MGLCKMFTYSLQQESFLHVDNDIFIWGVFPDEIIKARVACQNIEQIVPNSTDDYIRALGYMHKKFKSIPRFFVKARILMLPIWASLEEMIYNLFIITL